MKNKSTIQFIAIISRLKKLCWLNIIKSKAFSIINFMLILSMFFCFGKINSQEILPTPLKQEKIGTSFILNNRIIIAHDEIGLETAKYLCTKLEKYLKVKVKKGITGDIVLQIDGNLKSLGNEGYTIKVNKTKIQITANTDAGLFYGVQSWLQLLPPEIQADKDYSLVGTKIEGVLIEDIPKYSWRSFMLDSGRQYQTPEFIKRYLDIMAMLKMNVFHWHLTEGQGWRIEIKKYPKLTSIGSKVADGKEQRGYYSQETIKEIVAYAKKLHITIVPEIDVPGHSEAALTAYPELSCFGEIPETVMTFSSNIFCGGNSKTYQFLEDVLDEVCQLFPSDYIHLGGDEAPKDNWEKCSRCQEKIKSENLKDSHNLQLYFSSRLANYLKTKNKKIIFWGDVVYHDGKTLPDNVTVQWWNYYRYKDKAIVNGLKRGHQVIVNTDYYSYLNYLVKPWGRHKKHRTFDLKKVYENNPGDLENPSNLVLGMNASLWTDWYVQERMIDQRVFPRIYALAEQMWHTGERLSFDDFYQKVQNKYPLLKLLGIQYGPAMERDVPEGYKWD